MIDLEYSFFQRKTRELIGIDLSCYKGEQMRRRLNTMMARSGANNLFEYYRLISQDNAKRQEFRDFITINVSEFFRIPDRFDYLRENVFPILSARRRGLKVWSAGCSIGAEPYSLAIMLQELAPFGQWTISATDIDGTVLQKARQGIFAPADLRNVSSSRLKKFFVAAGDQFEVTAQVKSKVYFKVHDLLKDDYEKDFDLIVCRHVLIYFTEEAKDGIFERFQRSLVPGGILFLGGTETIRKPKDLGFEALSSSFYRKSGL